MVEFNLDQRLANDTILLKELALSKLLLMNEKKFPWVILVPRINDLVEISDLSEEKCSQLQQEIYFLSGKLKSLFNADKMNVAMLGNQVKQLHVHIIARYQKDACWPNPVWGNFAREEYSAPEVKAICSKIREAIS